MALSHKKGSLSVSLVVQLITVKHTASLVKDKRCPKMMTLDKKFEVSI